jgi:O-antigen/teichoic acid export membrane protein
VKNYWDRFGIFLSGLCVIHCIVLPFAFALFPALGGDLVEEKFHGYILGFILLSAFMAFVPTYMKHKKAKIFVLPTIAIIILSISTLFLHDLTHGWIEYAISILGSSILIYAHYRHILRHDHCCNDVHEHCDTALPDHGHPDDDKEHNHSH